MLAFNNLLHEYFLQSKYRYKILVWENVFDINKSKFQSVNTKTISIVDKIIHFFWLWFIIFRFCKRRQWRHPPSEICVIFTCYQDEASWSQRTVSDPSLWRWSNEVNQEETLTRWGSSLRRYRHTTTLCGH